MKPASEIELDASIEHPALTPLMRRLAAEEWAIVQAKADAVGFPIKSATLSVDHDVEGVDWVHVHVKCDAPFAETRAFDKSLNADYERWVNQLDPESREASIRVMALLYWIPASKLASSGV